MVEYIPALANVFIFPLFIDNACYVFQIQVAEIEVGSASYRSKGGVENFICIVH